MHYDFEPDADFFWRPDFGKKTHKYLQNSYFMREKMEKK